MINGKIPYKWSFSIAMLNYQRVNYKGQIPFWMVKRWNPHWIYGLTYLKFCLSTRISPTPVSDCGYNLLNILIVEGTPHGFEFSTVKQTIKHIKTPKNQSLDLPNRCPLLVKSTISWCFRQPFRHKNRHRIHLASSLRQKPRMTWPSSEDARQNGSGLFMVIHAPYMEYLPTFTQQMAQM